MNVAYSSLHKGFAMAVILTAMAPLLHAQQYKVEWEKPKYEAMVSPTINGDTAIKKFDPKEWLEVEMKFRIEAQNKDEDFADRVTVRWFVAAEVTENGSTRERVLEKEINYVNVPVGEWVYVSVYLSPTAVKRISGRDRAAASLVTDVGGEILVNGTQPVKSSGFFTTQSKSKGKWWEEAARYNKIPLRSKNETPFKFFWWDRYAEIDESR